MGITISPLAFLFHLLFSVIILSHHVLYMFFICSLLLNVLHLCFNFLQSTFSTLFPCRNLLQLFTKIFGAVFDKVPEGTDLYDYITVDNKIIVDVDETISTKLVDAIQVCCFVLEVEVVVVEVDTILPTLLVLYL
jgi:hypothetical protein